jgi:hypothetical protein
VTPRPKPRYPKSCACVPSAETDSSSLLPPQR